MAIQTERSHLLEINASVELSIDLGMETKQYPSRIEDIQGQNICVAMPTERLIPIIVPRGSRIGIWVTGETALYCLPTTVAEIRHNPIPIMLLEPCDSWLRLQRRYAYRLQKLMPVNKALLLREHGDSELVRALIRNLSAGGAFLEVVAPVAPRQRLRLGFTLVGQPTYIEATGEILWVEAPERRRRQPYQAGVRFIDLSQRDADEIVRYIFRQLRAERQWRLAE